MCVWCICVVQHTYTRNLYPITMDRYAQLFSRLVASIHDYCKTHNLQLITIESCTAGQIMSTLASLSGASRLLQGSIVTYSAEAKQDLVGVPKDLIDQHTAVSEPVAVAMAHGGLAQFKQANVAVSITGYLDGPEAIQWFVTVSGVRTLSQVGNVTHTKHYRYQAGSMDRLEARHQATLDALIQLWCFLNPV